MSILDSQWNHELDEQAAIQIAEQVAVQHMTLGHLVVVAHILDLPVEVVAIDYPAVDTAGPAAV